MAYTVSKALRANEYDPFAQDVIDFFKGHRSGHLSKWLYSVPQFPGDGANGSAEWAHVVEDAKNGSAYYVFNDERAIIESAASIVSAHLGTQVRLIDLGPGSADAVQAKIAPIIEASGSKISEYLAVDVSTEPLNVATDTIAELFPQVETHAIHQDFIEDHFPYGDTVPCEMAALFGLTLCNMPIDPRVAGLPEKILVAELKRLAMHYTAEDQYLVITQDTNQDVDQLRAAYLAIEPYYRPLLYRMMRDLDIQGTFDPNAFNVEVDFFAETQACSICFVVKDDMAFSIDGVAINLHKGQRLYFHNAFKFSRTFFERAVIQAGFKVIETVAVTDNPCVLYLLKTVPKEENGAVERI